MTPTLLNNRYKIIRALATGGFGHTFLAEDTYLPSRRHCVIKQLKPINNNPQTFQMVQGRFQREAAILEKLGDSNQQIPKLYAYFEEAGQFYLVQEFIGGQTLTDLVRTSGVLNDNSVQNILLDLLPVLDYVHSQGIIHRDVKPDNIILRQSDRKPVLIDFGAVKEVMTAAANGHSIAIGSPGFMPIEQAAGHPSYASDLYGLGLTAIYLLTGKLPQELGVDRGSGELLWRQYAPKVSPKLAAVLDKAIRSHPSERYSSARQML
ncbi:MAG TPA: serine/threonine protein kinase, partial [Cyanobacteria bacterium UBA11368]|nr:serine/threonine protein kinase [Cyanobacteria bacterium UBA11368]